MSDDLRAWLANASDDVRALNDDQLAALPPSPPDDLEPEERMLWAIREAGLPEPQREYRFHPTRQWRLDFAWPAVKVGLEVHGGVWAQGRHTRGGGFTDDREKMNEAIMVGWQVLEVTPAQIDDGSAIDWVRRLLRGNDKWFQSTS